MFLTYPMRQLEIIRVKLSNKGRYGIRAVFDIAYHNEGRATQIRAIAQRQGIPPRFLEQIFQELKRGGLVTSKRGPKGGYALGKPPEQIRIGDIIRALEGPIDLAGPEARKHGGDPTSLAITAGALQELGEALEKRLNETSVADLCSRGEAQGLRRRPPRRYVYSI